jgi:hypothetical protein
MGCHWSLLPMILESILRTGSEAARHAEKLFQFECLVVSPRL